MATDKDMTQDPVLLLEKAGVKPTSNRILVLKALQGAKSPMSLVEIETELQTLERSSILRVLTALAEHDVVHIMEDGRGITKYEVCRSDVLGSADDMHVHFFCEKCNRVYCFEDIHTPHISLPEEFEVKSVNFMLKGVCPSCRGK